MFAICGCGRGSNQLLRTVEFNINLEKKIKTHWDLNFFWGILYININTLFYNPLENDGWGNPLTFIYRRLRGISGYTRAFQESELDVLF